MRARMRFGEFRCAQGIITKRFAVSLLLQFPCGSIMSRRQPLRGLAFQVRPVLQAGEHVAPRRHCAVKRALVAVLQYRERLGYRPSDSRLQPGLPHTRGLPRHSQEVNTGHATRIVRALVLVKFTEGQDGDSGEPLVTPRDSRGSRFRRTAMLQIVEAPEVQAAAAREMHDPIPSAFRCF
jgi:hypothetical protein